MNIQDLQKQAEDELNAFRKETIFPQEKLPDYFHSNAVQALEFIPILKNTISPDEYHELVEPSGPYNLYQVGVILKVMQERSKKDMGFHSAVDYADFMRDWHQVNEAYNDIILPISKRIREKYEAQMQAFVQNPDKPDNTVPFKPSKKGPYAKA